MTPAELDALNAGASALRYRAERLQGVIDMWHEGSQTAKVKEARETVARYREQAELLDALAGPVPPEPRSG